MPAARTREVYGLLHLFPKETEAGVPKLAAGVAFGSSQQCNGELTDHCARRQIGDDAMDPKRVRRGLVQDGHADDRHAVRQGRRVPLPDRGVA